MAARSTSALTHSTAIAGSSKLNMHTQAQPTIRSSEELLRHPALPLERIFAPEAVALIGAREKAGSVGRTILENLRAGGFRGSIYPVNPKRHRVLGVRAYPSIDCVPRPVDLAIVATPTATVPDVIGECAKAGVAGAVVISAGFKECGEVGVSLEHMIQARRGATHCRPHGDQQFVLMWSQGADSLFPTRRMQHSRFSGAMPSPAPTPSSPISSCLSSLKSKSHEN